jgi:hypothetical protein
VQRRRCWSPRWGRPPPSGRFECSSTLKTNELQCWDVELKVAERNIVELAENDKMSNGHFVDGIIWFGGVLFSDKYHLRGRIF